MSPRLASSFFAALVLCACAHAPEPAPAPAGDDGMLKAYPQVVAPAPRSPSGGRVPVQSLSAADLAALEADSLAAAGAPATRRQEVASLETPAPAPAPSEPAPAPEGEGGEAQGPETDPKDEEPATTLGVAAQKKRGCKVSVDGKSLGKAPFRAKEVEPGKHRVVLTCKANKRYTTTVHLSAGEHEKLELAGKKLKHKRAKGRRA